MMHAYMYTCTHVCRYAGMHVHITPVFIGLADSPRRPLPTTRPFS